MVAAADRDAQTAVRENAAGAWAGGALGGLREVLLASFEHEWAERRFFHWLPVAAGAGVALYFAADREPSLWMAMGITAVLMASAMALRRSRRLLIVMTALAALAAGFTAATLRTAAITHPTLNRVRVAKLTGVIEEVDHRRIGARFVLRVGGGDGTAPGGLTRVRLTTRRSEPIEAGDAVRLTARLLPPAPAAMPGGFSFARDAYFQGFDAVGSVLGRIAPEPEAETPGVSLRFHVAVDRARNALAARVSQILDGDIGAIGAAMVTGKRDLLSDDGRELIREAGIFHIITIAGVQMTLVAGLLFMGLRAGLAAVPGLALRYPIKAWAAAGAMLGALAYDVATGSRIGTQRALIMTLILLGAVLLDRRAFTMRNLALAALVVIAIEPETVLGASFQLSFAAVAALVAVQESRRSRSRESPSRGRDARAHLGVAGQAIERLAATFAGAGRLLVATVAATSATAPVMASNFHEISPYVVLGNPLTLSVIEFFAVPGALLGAALYPLGLDRFVWHWVGWGIALVLWAARLIAAAPGATLRVPDFAPWSLGCFALAIASAVIWRTLPFRLSAVPFVVLGLLGTCLGPRYDLIVAPTGDSVAVRAATGSLTVVGRRNSFGATQWLGSDGDDPATVGVGAARCDALACVAALPSGKILSIVQRPEAFEEDCRRADLIVTPLDAPASCAAELIVDRGTLALTGALAFTSRNNAFVPVTARASGENRPWSPAPFTGPRTRPRPASRDIKGGPDIRDPAETTAIDPVTPDDAAQ